MKKTVLTGSALVMALALSACGSSGGGSSSKTQTLTVLAASSLTETFTDLQKTFEQQHKGVKVTMVFDSSATLEQQAAQQAPGDILATADKKTMDQAKTDKGISGDATEFATNTMVLAIPAANPAKLTSFAGIQAKGIDFLTCVPTAPCGSAAAALLKTNGITHAPASQEVDVKSVLQKIESGEADAGMVYVTDVTAAGDKVSSLPVPHSSDSPNTYWIAATAGTKQAKLSQEFIALLEGREGQGVLSKAGFGKP
jgi:molybdate transport system substrate-binding protein